MKKLFLSFSFLLLPFFAGAQEAIALNPVDTIPCDTLKKITLLFAGDLMQHQAQINAACLPNGGFDYSECFKYVKEEISRADIAIGNLEVTLAGPPYTGYPSFGSPDEYLYAIKDMGFDILLTANNHCLDRGRDGLERTILMLDSLHIPYTGTYIHEEARANRYPLLIEQNGFRISLLNYTYGTNDIPVTPPNVVNLIDKEVMEKDIEAAKAQQPDVIIVCIHWGEEYHLLPEDSQRELADWMLSKGVTHIIGGHPHVVQPIELRTDSVDSAKHLVVYSLGNFISNMSVPNADGGLLVRLELEKDNSTVRVSDCGYSMIWTARPGTGGIKNHTLFPVNYPKDSLKHALYHRMERFTNTARALFKEHNIGIEEYFFGEK
ncbi:Capsule biosynthesis protein CapA [termite gut metagenome]|uniref:Capsule biosynthesis protein CapA n=1 Tax=termite gut metagenome TaxID=433724 RepID=A0A5J4RBD7_9ZZZZ